MSSSKVKLPVPLELIRINVTLEHGFNADGDLVPLPGADPQEIPRIIVWKHRDGYLTYFHHDLPPTIRERLSRLDPERALRDPEAVKQVLSSEDPICNVWAGRGCIFARIPDPSEFPDAVLHEGCYVILQGGKPVAWAWSQARNERAAELAVEVLPEHRRRGYGRQVAAAWAHHVMHQGRVAFFSHVHGNAASQALAASLGVVEYGVSAAYT